MWSPEGQKARFESVLQALDPQPGEKLLDYGCGTGAFSTYIPQQSFYLGYDWSVGMVERAKRDHSEEIFSFDHAVAEIDYDYIACIGPFNLPDNWSKEETWTTLTQLWSHTDRALAVCLYSGNDPMCLAYDEEEAWDFGDELGGALVTRHLPNDLLLVVKRDADYGPPRPAQGANLLHG